MSLFEKLLYSLQEKMEEPVAFGWFHLFWLAFAAGTIYLLYKNKNNYGEKQLKLVLGIYGIVSIVLELGKQLIWAFNYDPISNEIFWDYEWYAFPFQLCTTPMYVSIFCLVLGKCKLRKYLLSYIAYITILGSIATIILPDSCFSSYVLVNVHTMWLHVGSFVVSIYLLISNEVKIEFENLIGAYCVFLSFAGIASILNIIIYNTGVLNGESFNMFYISPYFISELPVFSFLQSHLPYIPYLLSYICAIFIGGLLVYNVAKFLETKTNRTTIKNGGGEYEWKK